MKRLEHVNVRKSKSKVGKKLVDGKGSLRIASILKGSSNESLVSFR